MSQNIRSPFFGYFFFMLLFLAKKRIEILAKHVTMDSKREIQPQEIGD